jgi:citrate lyase subunit beta / citryl-CoA lyase
MTILRSLLFVPGNKPSMLDKALGLRPDAFVPDMEDSVPAASRPKMGDSPGGGG